MIRIFGVLILALFAAAVFGQGPKAKPTALAGDEAELAKLVLAAHGGDKLRNMRSLAVSGSAEVTTTAFNQAFPGTFSMMIAGDKYALELRSVQSFKQTFDGKETFSTIQGLYLPPLTSLGLPLLQKIGSTGYTIGKLSAASGKKRGFRITTPSNTFTDFFVDAKTMQVSGYESSFEVNGRTITTSAVIDKYRAIDGVLVPEKYSQRFDLGQLTAYASFKAKEISVDQDIADSVFAAPAPR